MQKQLAILPGDGIGPEVTEQALKVLDAVAERFDYVFKYEYSEIGAKPLKERNNPLPESTVKLCRESDAVLLGATGHPYFERNPSVLPRPEDGLLALRKELGLYANLRPVQIFQELKHLSPLKQEHLEDQEVDLLIVRELTSGLYFGEKGRTDGGKAAYDMCVYSTEEVERITRLAFRLATERRQKLALVDKAHVLETSRLWREVVLDLQSEYADVEVAYFYAEHMAMGLILNPGKFDVILTSNLIGDMLGDEAAVLTGSLGLLPSSSRGKCTSIYEPVHGAWPDAAGKDIANPIGSILSVAMLLRDGGMEEAGSIVKRAVEEVLKKGLGTPDMKPHIPCHCSQLGDLIAHMVLDEDRLSLQAGRIAHRVSTII